MYLPRGSAGVDNIGGVYVTGPAAESTNPLHVRTVVCSPHFDDAVLSCWSVLERDPGCAVVNVFTGAPAGARFTSWYDQMNGASSSATHMRQRALEDRDALSVAGKTPIDLGMLEVQYRLRQSPWLHTLFRRVPPLRFVMVRLPFLRSTLYTTSAPGPEQIADAIAQAVPGATSVCVPAGIGGHTDHLLVRQAGAVLASQGINVRLYADMPYAVRYGWPRWIGAPGERTNDRASTFWARHFESLCLGNVIEQATVVRRSPGERARKVAAIRRYHTQIDSLGAGRRRGWLQDEKALAYEVYWELRTPRGAHRRS
jgi:hypothetical protein